MVEKVMVVVPAAFPAAEIVAVEVSAEGYMDKYAAEFHEWVKGVLHYLIMLLEACADICIEIVSPESVTRDYGDKFVEYEKAGVQEYGIIDPNRTSCHFKLHVPTLWQDELPKTGAVAETMVSRRMLHRGKDELPKTGAVAETVKKMFAEDAV